MKKNDGRNVYFIDKQNEVESCYQYLKNEKILSLDIETTRKFNNKYGKEEGLDPYLSNIVMLQIGNLERQYILDVRKVYPDKLLNLLEDKSITIVGHNLKFEYKHIIHKYNIRLNNIYDTMVVEQVLFNGLNYKNGLKDLISRYLHIEIDKTIRLGFLSIKDRDFSKDEINYGADDIINPLLIRNIQLNYIKEKDVNKCIQLELLFTLVLGDIEYKGINFNKKVWEDNSIKNKELVEIYLEKLNKFVIKHFLYSVFIDKQYDIFSNKFKCIINWDSPLQVKNFFIFLGITPIEKSKSTNKRGITVESKALESYLKTTEIEPILREFAEIYLKYKKSKKAVTSFGTGFFKYINPITNRIHSNYRQILHTGRISSQNPNLQNIPSEDIYRRAFDAPIGSKIVNADYSGQEQIILANKSQDKDLLKFYQQGFSDMHSYIASKIYPELIDLPLRDIKKYHKDKRQIAKAAGFAINYGGNGFTIAKNIGISTKIGDEVYNAYFTAFPGLNDFFKKGHRKALNDGYILIDNITKRKYWYNKYDELKEAYKSNNFRQYYKLKHTLEKASQNFSIQGEAGSITKYAAILFREWIIINKLEQFVFINNLIHDEISVECKEEYAQITAINLTNCMEKAGDLWCKIVPLKADAVITTYWTH